MSKNVNLLPAKKKAFLQEKKIIGKLRLVSVLFLCAVGVSSVVLFFLQFNSPLIALKREEQAALSDLKQLEKKSLQLLLVKNTISTIDELIKNRAPLETSLDILNKNIPDSLTVDNFTIEKQRVVMNISSTSLAAIDQFLTNIIAVNNEKKVFSKITLDGITVEGGGSKYLVSITILKT